MPKPKSSKSEKRNTPKKNKKEIEGASSEQLHSESESGFLEFVKKPLPNEKEVKQLDEYVENEIKEEEVNDSLSEIYQDDKGHMVDVDKMDIRKRGFFSWLFTTSLFLFIVGGIVFLAYNYLYLPSLTDSTAVEITISGEENVLAGEEYSYIVSYKNMSNVVLNNVDLEIKYPDNFMVLDASPGSDNFRNWHFDSLSANFNGKITIKGKMIAPVSYSGILLADITYTPANFSSEFKKESSFVTTISDTGINFSIDYISSVMVGEENDIYIKFKEKDESYLGNFRISVDPVENISFSKYDLDDDYDYSVLRPGIFEVNEIKDGEGEVLLRIKVDEKINDSEELVFNFSQVDNDNNYKVFYTEKVSIDVIKSNLSLTMIINGKKNDQGVSFGDTLNYSIVYANKGDTEMSDVIVMAVLDSEFLNWDSLSDLNGGDISGNTITWSKEEIPELETLDVRDEGFIDFSINMVNSPNKIYPEKNYSVSSYAQYRTGSSTADAFLSESNKSNIIKNKISSDLSFSERILYFDDDSNTMGDGLYPPRVGKKTKYRVYWELSNSLHELDNALVTLAFPEYLSYEKKTQSSLGNIIFNEQSRTLSWEIGNIPITTQKVSASFDIGIVPTEEYLNKIMILSPGASVTAHDSEADTSLSLKSQAKTTRLEDDPVAISDGLIRE